MCRAAARGSRSVGVVRMSSSTSAARAQRPCSARARSRGAGMPISGGTGHARHGGSAASERAARARGATTRAGEERRSARRAPAAPWCGHPRGGGTPPPGVPRAQRGRRSACGRRWGRPVAWSARAFGLARGGSGSRPGSSARPWCARRGCRSLMRGRGRRMTLSAGGSGARNARPDAEVSHVAAQPPLFGTRGCESERGKALMRWPRVRGRAIERLETRPASSPGASEAEERARSCGRVNGKAVATPWNGGRRMSPSPVAGPEARVPRPRPPVSPLGFGSAERSAVRRSAGGTLMRRPCPGSAPAGPRNGTFAIDAAKRRTAPACPAGRQAPGVRSLPRAALFGGGRRGEQRGGARGARGSGACRGARAG